MRSSTHPRTGRPTRRSRLVVALAGAALLLATTVSPGGAQSTNEAEDEPAVTLTPNIQRVAAGTGTDLSQTVVRGDFWVRVYFENADGVAVNVGALGQSILSVTNGSVISFRRHSHSEFPHIGYWTVSPNDGVAEMTVSVDAGVVTDTDGNTNTAGSVTYTAEAPLTPTLSTTAVDPVLDGSFEVTVTANYPALNDGCSVGHMRAYCHTTDVTVSRGSVESVSRSDDGRSHTVKVHEYGSDVGFITVGIAAEKFTLGDGTRTWNVASNELKVFVGAPFDVEGESSFDFVGRLAAPVAGAAPEGNITRLSAAVGTYGVSDSDATVSWSLTGDDRAEFQISNDGELSFVGAPGFAYPADLDSDSVYHVTVNATSDDYGLAEDLGGRSFTVTKEVAVTVILGVAQVIFDSDTAWLRGTYGGFYERGDDIRVAVMFPDEVTVTGSPQIVLDVGENERVADYLGQDGAGAFLMFRYKVVAGDDDPDGVSIDANSLSLNGGSILDRYGHAVSLDHTAVAADSEQLVNAPPLPIERVIITSQPGAERGSYGQGDRIVISANSWLNEAMTVTGTPQITLNIGENERIASYTSNNEGTLLFEYTVVSGDIDTDGISINANSLSLNGGTINDVYGGAAQLEHRAVQPDQGQRVSAPLATISRVSIEDPYRGDRALQPPAPGDDDYPAYGQGDVVVVFVEFSEAVSVGTRIDPETEAEIGPILTLSIGDTTADAAYVSIDGRKLRFEYTVAVGDTDTDGISINADSLSLNGATINDATGVAATLSHTAVAADAWLAVVAPGGL